MIPSLLLQHGTNGNATVAITPDVGPTTTTCDRTLGAQSSTSPSSSSSSSSTIMHSRFKVANAAIVHPSPGEKNPTRGNLLGGAVSTNATPETKRPISIAEFAVEAALLALPSSSSSSATSPFPAVTAAPTTPPPPPTIQVAGANDEIEAMRESKFADLVSYVTSLGGNPSQLLEGWTVSIKVSSRLGRYGKRQRRTNTCYRNAEGMQHHSCVAVGRALGLSPASRSVTTSTTNSFEVPAAVENTAATLSNCAEEGAFHAIWPRLQQEGWIFHR
jgi:hypothetical protein